MTDFPGPEVFPDSFHEVRGDYLDNQGKPISLYQMMVMAESGEAIIGSTRVSTQHDSVHVSTVNLFHNPMSSVFRIDTGPRHFETMVFVEKGRHKWGDQCYRYKTFREAAAGHWYSVAIVASSMDKPSIQHEREAPTYVDGDYGPDSESAIASGAETQRETESGPAEGPRGEITDGDVRI